MIETNRKRASKGNPECRLGKMRIKRGMSQKDLATASGVSSRAIRGYEQGELLLENAKLNTLCDLCLALGCKIEDIIEDDDLIEKLKALK